MELRLIRQYRKEDYTIGKLYINGVYFCDTLEDKDRGLDDRMSEAEIKAKKVYGQTAIPTGRYKITLTYSRKFGRVLPLLWYVKAFDGVRIHRGNTAKDTYGCPLVGKNKAKGMVLDSAKTETALLRMMKNETDITITIL